MYFRANKSCHKHVTEFKSSTELLHTQFYTIIRYGDEGQGVIVFTDLFYFEKLLGREESTFLYLSVRIPRVIRKVCFQLVS